MVTDIAKLSDGQEDYYVREVANNREEYLSGHGESPGRWLGRGAQALGQQGTATTEAFVRMFHGRHHPDGYLHTDRLIPSASRLPQPHRQGPRPRPRPGQAGLLGRLRRHRARRRGRVAEARRRAKWFAAKWQPLYPSAVACVANNLDALMVHLLFPAEHRKRIRHSNLIERTFGETRRRGKVIGRLPGEQNCLSLVWAVLDCAAKGWRGRTMTPKALRRLQDLRRELLSQPPLPLPEEAIAKTVTTAA